MSKREVLWGFLLMLMGFSCSGERDVSTPDPTNYSIHWDKSSLVKVSHEGMRYAGYGRSRQLEDGAVGFVYEADGAVFFRKHSKGQWEAPVLVAAAEAGVAMAVPDFTVLKDGTILLAYNPRPRNAPNSRHFAIRTVRSEDNGNSWIEDQLVYEAGVNFGDGCWEPVFLQLPNGELQLYFADEGIFTHSDEQRIAMVTSTDQGHSWSKDPQTVSYRKGARDGMPVPIWLAKKERIALSIEDNGFGPFKPYMIFNEGSKWKGVVNAESKHRKYAMAEKLPPADYAGAPYLAQLSNGLTLLSFQWGKRLENAQMAVAIGNGAALGFTNITFPFPIPSDKFGHWNSISVGEGDQVVALTSTNAYSSNGNTEVWMITGKIQKK